VFCYHSAHCTNANICTANVHQQATAATSKAAKKPTLFHIFTLLYLHDSLRLFLSFFHVMCSTREIKPNQTDIGRKITKKPSAVPSQLYSNSNGSSSSNNRTTQQQPTPNSLASSSSSLKRPLALDADRPNGGGAGSSDGGHLTASQQQQQQQQQIPATNSSLSYSNSSQQQQQQDHHHDAYHPSTNHQHHHNPLNGVVVGDVPASSTGHNLTNRSGSQQRNPDIMKKPIK